MITDLNVQHELLKTALEATDNYLAYEKRAIEAGRADNVLIHNFTYEMSRAHDALQALGVLDQHQDYMENHAQTMLKLHGHQDQSIADLPYAHIPGADVGEVEEETKVWDKPSPVKNHEKLSPQAKAKAKARAKAAGRPYPNMVDNIWAARNESVVTFKNFLTEKKSFEELELTEEDLNEIVNNWSWEDQWSLYDDSELVEEDDNEEVEIEEGLTAQGRIKKRQAFRRTKGKRNVARGIKLRRASTVKVLQKRAKLAARRALYKRFLRGRDKASLSAAEKTRIEQQVGRLKYLQQVLSTRLMPKMRAIETKRLAGYRSKSKKPTPSKAPKLKK